MPTGLANGPWYPGTQHGSAMLGLLARAVDRHPCDDDMQVTRFTTDLMRAAPMAPVETRVRTIRRSRSVELVEASLSADGSDFTRASAMRFIVNPVEIPEESRGEAPSLTLPLAHTEPMLGSRPGDEAFHHALELRPVPGFELPVVWLRLTVPLVEGEEPGPLVRVAVASDFSYSLPTMRKMMSDPGAIVHQGFTSINPDTSLNLHRPLQGEWVALDARVFHGELGAGSAFAQIQDEVGVVGHVSQSLLVRSEEMPARWKKFKK